MGPDDRTNPVESPTSAGPSVLGSVEAAVHALADIALEQPVAAGTSPLLWWVTASDTPDLPGSVVARFSLDDPQVCDPQLEALRGLHAPSGVVGAALVVPAAVAATDGEEVEAHAVRVAQVVLRDGTAAYAVDGGGEVLGVSGRVEVYLRRTLGLRSGVAAPDPRMFAARCWLWSHLRRLTETFETSAVPGARFEGLSAALVLMASAAAAGESWGQILDRVRASAADPAADPQDPRLPGEPYAPMVELLGWMDAELFAVEVSAMVPSFEELSGMWSALGDVPCAFSTVADTALSAVGL